MKQMLKRSLALILAICMVVGLMPALSVSAAANYKVAVNNGTASVSNVKVKEGNSYTLPAALDLSVPVPSGWVFKGWEDDDSNRYAPGESVVITKNVTFDPYFELAAPVVPAFTVTVEQGSGNVTETVAKGAAFTLPDDYDTAAPAGQKFIAWKSGSDYYVPGADVTVNGDMTFTPYFIDENAEEYLVKYVVDGKLADFGYTVDRKLKTLEGPFMEGCTFWGWVTDWLDAFDENETVIFTQDTTLYGVYDYNVYDVKLSTESSTHVTVTGIPGEGKYMDDYKFYAVPDMGYEIVGIQVSYWRNTVPVSIIGVNEYSFVIPSGDVTVKIVTTETESFNVKIDNGTASVDQDVLAGSTITLPALDASVTVPENMRFAGWTDELTKLTYEVGAVITVNQDYSFVPMFVAADEYVAKFLADGVMVDTLVTDHQTVTAPAAPAKVGYTFLSWGCDAPAGTYAEGEIITLAADAVFTANYELNTYDVTLSAFAANVTVAELPVTGAGCGSDVPFTVVPDDGYEIVAVSASYVDAEGVTHTIPVMMTDEGSYVLTVPAGDVTVDVALKTALYTVKFYVDDALYETVNVPYGTVPSMPAEPVKENTTFLGWQAEDGTVYTTALPVVTADAAFTAVFETNTYDLLFYRGTEADESEYKAILHMADGTVVEFYNDDAVVDGEKVMYPVHDVAAGSQVRLGYAELPGYTFAYWLDENGNHLPEGSTYTMPDHDALLTAVWTEINDETVLVRFLLDGRLYDAHLAYVNAVGTVPADPELPGRTFKGWENEGTLYSLAYGGGHYTVVADENREMTFVAVLEDAPVNISVVTENCTTTLTPGTAMPGDTVSFTVTPSDGNAVASVEISYTDAVSTVVRTLTPAADGTYTFTVPYADVTVTAKAAKNVYSVYTSAATGTTITVPTGTKAAAGTAVTFTTDVLDNTYSITSVYVLTESGVPVALTLTGAGYVFEMPAEDVTIVTESSNVVYAPFTVSAGELQNVIYLKAESEIHTGNVNSSDLLVSSLSTEAGAAVSYTVAAHYDYQIEGIAVVGAGSSKTAVQSYLVSKEVKNGVVYYTYSFTMPADDVTISVYTTAKSCKVDVTEVNPEGGDYTLNGYHSNNLVVPQGENVTIDITPAPGYVVESVTGTFFDGFSETSLVDYTLNADNTLFTFPMVAKDVHVVITYKAIDYTVEIETSNFASYKPDASLNPAKVVESLDLDLTSKGRIELMDGTERAYTNAEGQIYMIPANGTANAADRVAFTVVEYYGYDVASVIVSYEDGARQCPLTYIDGIYYFDMPADDVVITAQFVEETWTVYKDIEAQAYGTVTINGLTENQVSADYKSEVTVEVTPKTGYQVTKIYYVVERGFVMDFDEAVFEAAAITDTLDSVHSLTFRMPASNVKVFVEYAAIDYTISDITAQASVSGYTSPATVGQQIRFTTAADYGYIITNVYAVNELTGEFVNLHTGSTNTTKGANYFFTMPAAPVTIHVETTEDIFDVIYLDVYGAFVGGEEIAYLQTAHVSQYAGMISSEKAGCHFAGWTSEDTQTPVTTPSVEDADFVVVKKTYIKAVYEKDDVKIIFWYTQNGTVTETSTGNTAYYELAAKFGDTVQFTAVPDEGYVIESVHALTHGTDGRAMEPLIGGIDGSYAFIVPATYKENARQTEADSIMVLVNFTKDSFTLTQGECGTEGTIAVNGEIVTETAYTYYFEDEVSITAAPDAGCYVVSITAENEDGTVKFETTGEKPAVDTASGEALTLSFQMPACDLSYTVVYAKCDYSITTVCDETKGTVEAPATAQVGDMVTAIVTPAEGYVIGSVVVTYANGEKALLTTTTGEGDYTFEMPADAVTVTAEFVENTYNVTLTVNGEADTTLNGVDAYVAAADFGSTVTVTVTPAEGWELVSLSVNEDAVAVAEPLDPMGGAYTFVMPAGDANVVVTLTKTEFTLESFACNFFEDGHGTITVTPAENLHKGDNVTIIADPDGGYRVKEVIVMAEDGTAIAVSFIAESADYVQFWGFTMPAQNVTIVVVFEVDGSAYYTDVRTDSWYYDAVTFVTDRGYFNGVTEDLFAPRSLMNRAMFVTVLGRIAGVDVDALEGVASFEDVNTDRYYAPYVAWAAEYGIVLGKSETVFDPNASITRQEMAAIMYRFCDVMGCDMTQEHEEFLGNYVDLDRTSDWARPAVEWALGVGLIHGTSWSTVSPRDNATRAQVAQVIQNLCDKVLYQ